ncbi:MAG: Tab2/Atab2 family RNA-binding protein, partial [Spirulina sp.]
MTIWQADLYLSSPASHGGEVFWELVLCDRQGDLIYEATCPQKQVHLDWLRTQWQKIDRQPPDRLQVFRPQCASLFENLGQQLGIPLEATRHTS